MSVPSRVLERYLRLPPAVTRAVRVRRDIEVPMRDGVVLRADHWEPRLPGAPTILVRTPYGRAGMVGLLSGRILAERGYQVLVQSCRGTFDSGGVWDPMRHERADGLDTIDWIRAQPWFTGDLFTYGPSYLGYTQWALAVEAGPELKGMLTAVTASAFRDPTYAGGSYSLATILNWATITTNLGGSALAFAYKQNRAQRRLRRAFSHLPLSEVDTMALGRPVPFFQEWLEHCEPDDPYWTERVCADVSTVQAPVCMVGGWYDIFLPWQLRDYATLRGAGAQPRLVIGAWTHADTGLITASVREGVSWFAAARNGGTTGGVSVHIGGINEWRDLPSWPPHSRRTPWYLRPGMRLAPEPPSGDDAPTGDEAPDRFRYDPADPTPSPGGALLTTEAGPKDNRVVERRPDILVYSGEELAEDLEAIGPVTATIRVRTSGEHFDVHVRLCDVHPDGRSVNLSDGIRRVGPGEAPPDPDGVRAVEVELWPIGHVFKRGHRLRVHVAGGAHPRSARNPGTGEPLGSATALRTVDFEVYHDAAHPSALHLPA
jgi:uncharacterized protein